MPAGVPPRSLRSIDRLPRPDLAPVLLVKKGVTVSWQLAPHCRPPTRVCSSARAFDPHFLHPSRRRPCASLALHLHQVEQGICTPKLSNMFGTQQNGRLRAAFSVPASPTSAGG